MSDILDIAASGIKTLPHLGHQLRELYCRDNELEQIHYLPTTLNTLDCAYNNITKLPDKLPQNLTDLDCSDNKLTVIPPLPNGLSSINICINPLLSIPKIPDSVISLALGGEGVIITALEKLPPQLKYLWCSGTDIQFLPPLPDTIINLYCYSNRLTTLPERLPPGLIDFNCSENKLRTLPSHLPSSLITLNCEYNCLDALPDPLPPKLSTLNCSGNNIAMLPDLPKTLTHFYFMDRNNNPPLKANYPRLYTDLINSNICEKIAYVNEVNAQLRALTRPS